MIKNIDENDLSSLCMREDLDEESLRKAYKFIKNDKSLFYLCLWFFIFYFVYLFIFLFSNFSGRVVYDSMGVKIFVCILPIMVYLPSLIFRLEKFSSAKNEILNNLSNIHNGKMSSIMICEKRKIKGSRHLFECIDFIEDGKDIKNDISYELDIEYGKIFNKFHRINEQEKFYILKLDNFFVAIPLDD